MQENFYFDNSDLLFYFNHLDIDEVIRLRESDFTETALGGAADLQGALRAYDAKLREIGELACGDICARAADVDRTGAVCVEHCVTIPEGTRKNLEALKTANVTGVTLPRQYGGLNFPTTIYTMMTEIVSRADASLQNLFGLQSIAETIRHFGSEEQKNQVLPRFASGEWDGAMCLTEPEAGSDLQSIQTTATLGEDGVWRLNGLKHFITNGIAKVVLVLARSEEGTRDARGLSMFLVHPCPELVVNRIEDKMGIHGSPTCELQFNNTPAELVGKRKMGLIRYVLSLMNGARLAIGAQAVGLSEACRRAAWDYCNQRRQFGKALSDLAPVREMLTRMDALTAASRALLYETCKWVDRRDAWTTLSEAHPEDRSAAAKAKEYARLADVLTPMTKAFSTESANQCAYDCIQCHGGKGYMRERPVERFYRDARIMNIYEGTTQMQVIAAIAGIGKGTLDTIFTDVEAFDFSADARRELPALLSVKEDFKALMAAFVASPSYDLLARRVVRGLTIVLAAELLLKGASQDASRLDCARRFIWEFLPEAEMHASVIRKTLEP